MASDIDWRSHILSGCLAERIANFRNYQNDRSGLRSELYGRRVLSSMDRTVVVACPFEGTSHEMIMMGSNNYLGLANHPRVKQAVQAAISDYGVGVAGPPLLNGNSLLHRELEEKLADMKGHEDACLFASGYQANLGICQALITSKDQLFFDEKSHASLYRGLRPLMGGRGPWRPRRFRHNDYADLAACLESATPPGDVYVAVEGVYSMQGDAVDLAEIDRLRQIHGFKLILDDAHGLGVLGQGRGTEHHYGMWAEVSMGTFSKSMAVTGGYVAGDKDLVEYLRFFAEAAVFSASLPIPTVAAVLEGLRIIEEQPEIVEQLLHNARYMQAGLEQMGYRVVAGDSAILALPIPAHIDIRALNKELHCSGLFVNAIEPPAVPAADQMLRLSLSTVHTRKDLNTALGIMEKVGRSFQVLREEACLV